MNPMEIEPDRASTGSDSAPSQDTASKQQLKAFHPFPRLPQEIKDMIWEMAIRPAYERGVQRFSIVGEEIFRSGYDSDYDFDSDDDSESESGFDLELKSKPEPGPAFASRSASESNEEPRAVRWAKPFDSRTNRGIQVVLGHSHRISASRSYHFLAAPKVPASEVPDSGQTTYSWKYPSNKSTYTWDMGLWQASRASREAMMKHYNPTFWARASISFSEEDKERTAFLLPDAPVLALSNEGEEALPVLTHPDSDLFIFDLKDFPIGVDFNQVFDNISDIIGRNKSTQSYKGIQHIGIQHNSQLWTEALEAEGKTGWERDSSFGSLIRLLEWAIDRKLDEEKPAPYIWLIDQRMWVWEGRVVDCNDMGRAFYRDPVRFERIDGTTYTEVAGSTYMGRADEEPKYLKLLDYPTANACWWKVWYQTNYYSDDPRIHQGEWPDWELVKYLGVLAGRAVSYSDGDSDSDEYCQGRPKFGKEDLHARL
jgi:hypothetical protein